LTDFSEPSLRLQRRKQRSVSDMAAPLGERLVRLWGLCGLSEPEHVFAQDAGNVRARADDAQLSREDQVPDGATGDLERRHNFADGHEEELRIGIH
jgi:hypothetical protein